MTLTDILILIFVVALLALIIYFSIIRPKIKHQSTCCKCPYSKQCGKKDKSCCENKEENTQNK